MTETLQEYSDSRGMRLRIDAEAGVLRGVKILGLTSRNGRVYLPEALAQATVLYEGAKVNVNHPKGSPLTPRDYQDRIGQIRNVLVRAGEGLFGDLHYNPKHALAEQLAWDAEHAPENVGFSHNVEARTVRRGEQLVVEAITRVQSVDLVADPATTRGLFEQAEMRATAAARATGSASAAAGPSSTGSLAEVTLHELKAQRPDLCAAVLSEQAAELARLREEVARLRAAELVHQRHQAARALLAEFELPDPETGGPAARAIVGEAFFETLVAAESSAAMRRLVEERARLVRELRRAAPSDLDGRPSSRDQVLLDAWMTDRLDSKAFVKAIT